MNEFIEIAQENFAKTQKIELLQKTQQQANCKKRKLLRQEAFWRGFCKGVEKAIILACSLSIVISTVLLILMAIDRWL